MQQHFGSLNKNLISVQLNAQSFTTTTIRGVTKALGATKGAEGRVLSRASKIKRVFVDYVNQLRGKKKIKQKCC